MKNKLLELNYIDKLELLEGHYDGDRIYFYEYVEELLCGMDAITAFKIGIEAEYSYNADWYWLDNNEVLQSGNDFDKIEIQLEEYEEWIECLEEEELEELVACL